VEDLAFERDASGRARGAQSGASALLGVAILVGIIVAVVVGGDAEARPNTVGGGADAMVEPANGRPGRRF
jgi:hypothetical protein